MPAQRISSNRAMEIAIALVVNFFAIHGYLTLVAETTVWRSAVLTLISLGAAGIGVAVYRRGQVP
jgi:hypothetical protein